MRTTIGAAAAATGLTRKAVRLYEAHGLLAPTERTPAGYRVYTDTDLRRLRFIAAARRLGLHLDQIADILTASNGKAPCGTTRALLDQRIAEIDRVITELRSLRDALAIARDTDAAGGSGICPIIESTSR
jgi:MerR family copper efflux transcriptional regulator